MRDPITRRRLMQRGAGAALGATLLAQLAACGGDGSNAAPEAPAEVPAIPKGEVSDSLYFANWPLYMEEDRGTLKEFREEYGTRIRYVEEINDNQEFFGKVQRQYQQGNSGGRDLHVLSGWMAQRMIRLGYVQKLDQSELPNVRRNLIDRLRADEFSRGRDFSVPWQAGMTGLIYRKDKIQREPRSVNDLFDPAYKGKVTLLSEVYDTVPMVMLGQGADPAEATLDQMLAAVEKVGEAAESGHVRSFTGNEYTKDLLKGDSWLVLGWSGDAIQLQADNPDVTFVQPEEGFLLWSDDMQIPVGAPHAYTAQKLMDFVFRPEVQVDITEWVNYVCPVKGVQELLEKRDPELAHSELIFPTAETLERATDLRPLDAEEEQELEAAFQQVIGA